MLLLTGATGYLGSAVAAALATRGEQFRCLGRGNLPIADVPWIPWELSAAEPIDGGVFTDVSAVVHCAGVAHRMASALEYEQVNVRASEKLATAAAEAGVQHFIYISSLNVVPPAAADPTVLSESLPDRDEPYALSKKRAEIALQKGCEGYPMALTVIRPALMFDQDLTANLATLERALRWLPVLLPDKGRRSLVSRSDVVQLILACVDGNAGAPTGQPVVAATDGGCYSAQAISRSLGVGKLGGDRSAFALPESLCQLTCGLLDWYRGSSWGSTWRALSAEHWCGTAREVIGWRPSLTLKTRMGER